MVQFLPIQSGRDNGQRYSTVKVPLESVIYSICTVEPVLSGTKTFS